MLCLSRRIPQLMVEGLGQMRYRMAGQPWAPEISTSLFSLRSGHPDFIFLSSVEKKKGLDIRVKNSTFRAFFSIRSHATAWLTDVLDPLRPSLSLKASS